MAWPGKCVFVLHVLHVREYWGCSCPSLPIRMHRTRVPMVYQSDGWAQQLGCSKVAEDIGQPPMGSSPGCVVHPGEVATAGF